MTITEAAAALGVSPDTIRRRIRQGIIKADQVRTAQGYRWEVTDLGKRAAGQQQDAYVNALLDRIASLEHELDARRIEVQQLHSLLHQKALPGPGSVPWYKRLFKR